MKALRQFATFYGYFVLSAVLLTISCMGPFWRFGLETLAVIFWFKIGTLVTTVFWVTAFKKKEFFYFRNLGLSPVILWAVTLFADMLLFGVFLLFIYYIKWRTH
jgi:hypothetical protein